MNGANAPRLAQSQLDGLDLEPVELEFHGESRVLSLEQAQLLYFVLQQVCDNSLHYGDVARDRELDLRVAAVGLVETQHNSGRSGVVLAEIVVQPALDGLEEDVRSTLDTEARLRLEKRSLGGVLKQANYRRIR